MNTHLPISQWSTASTRPFAPSLERLRLQTYAMMFACDMAIIMVSFMISGAIRSGNFLLPTAIGQAHPARIIRENIRVRQYGEFVKPAADD